MTDWTSYEEQYLTKMHKSSAVLEEYNRKQYIRHTDMAKRYAIPIVIISSINSVFSVSGSGFIGQKYVSIGTALLSLICGVLSSITMLLKIQEKINNYIIVCKEFQSIKYAIGKELSISRDKRPCNGVETVQKFFNEYQSALEKMEIREKKVNDYLLLESLPLIIPSETSSNDSPMSSEESDETKV